jgi:hypothetical protein
MMLAIILPSGLTALEGLLSSLTNPKLCLKTSSNIQKFPKYITTFVEAKRSFNVIVLENHEHF